MRLPDLKLKVDWEIMFEAIIRQKITTKEQAMPRITIGLPKR
jgi:hypothetical protein